jgi:hypothetical protein
MNPFHRLCVLSSVLAGCGIVAEVRAQHIAPLQHPAIADIADNGQLSSLVVQPDGGIVMTGSFTSVQGVPRKGVARLLPDGSVDPVWNPAPASLSPNAFSDKPLLANADGSIVMFVGSTTTIGGVTRSAVVKLAGSGSGAADAGFAADNPSCGTSSAHSVGAWIYVYDHCTSAVRRRATHDFAFDATWQAPLATFVNDLVDDGAGSLYAATGSRMYKISIASGAIDTGWTPTAVLKADREMVWDGEGALYVPNRTNGITKISTSGTGAVVAGWNYAGPITDVLSIAPDGMGSVYVGGASSSGVVLTKLVAATGQVVESFSAEKTSSVRAVRAYGPGRIAFGGDFPFIGADARLSFARLDGTTLAPATDLENAASFWRFAAQPDGGMVVGGMFAKANGLSRRHLLRLNADGTLDTQWRPRLSTPPTLMTADSSGSVFLSGSFSVDDVPINGVVKLAGSGAGARDAAWQPNPNGLVDSMVADDANRLYLFGRFTQVNGVARDHVARVSTLGSGAVDPGWNPSTPGWPSPFATVGASHAALIGNALYVTADLHNAFATPSTSQGQLYRYAIDSSAPADVLVLAATDDSYVRAIAAGSAGSVMLGGAFNSIGGVPRSRLARVVTSPTLAVDPSWNASIAGSINGLAADNDNLYLVGWFTAAGGQPRKDLAKIAKVDGSAVGWIPNWHGVDQQTLLGARGIGIAGNRIYVTRGTTRSGLAAYPLDAGDTIFADGFD